MIYENRTYDEERALYGLRDAAVRHCRFEGPADGESALKECARISVEDCHFDLRYPFWHVTDATVRRCSMTENCRAALWYDKNVTLENCEMNGIKALRECDQTVIAGCEIVSPEFAWRCRGLTVNDTRLEAQYPFFECSDMKSDGLTLHGKYSFQYVENAVIRNAKLHTKDAFWHACNVVVEDSLVEGEYLGWYSENLRLVRCRITGTQPLCYCKNLILEDCVMEGADFAFENSEVIATLRGHVISVKNPICGSITADTIGEIILDAPRDPITTCRITARKA